jgi:predicted RNase H-like nuclease (RuvC/YqgF family)
MKGARNPHDTLCVACNRSYLGSDGDPCPRCGGDPDVAGFKRAIDYKALATDLQHQLAALTTEVEALRARVAELEAKNAALEVRLLLKVDETQLRELEIYREEEYQRHHEEGPIRTRVRVLEAGLREAISWWQMHLTGSIKRGGLDDGYALEQKHLDALAALVTK